MDNGWPKSKYLCGLSFVLFVIGRWTHIDTLENFVVDFEKTFTIYNTVICKTAYGTIDFPIYVIYVE